MKRRSSGEAYTYITRRGGVRLLRCARGGRRVHQPRSPTGTGALTKTIGRQRHQSNGHLLVQRGNHTRTTYPRVLAVAASKADPPWPRTSRRTIRHHVHQCNRRELTRRHPLLQRLPPRSFVRGWKAQYEEGPNVRSRLAPRGFDSRNLDRARRLVRKACASRLSRQGSQPPTRLQWGRAGRRNRADRQRVRRSTRIHPNRTRRRLERVEEPGREEESGR